MEKKNCGHCWHHFEYKKIMFQMCTTFRNYCWIYVYKKWKVIVESKHKVFSSRIATDVQFCIVIK